MPNIRWPRTCSAMYRRLPQAKPKWLLKSIARPGRSRAPMNTGCGDWPTAKGAARPIPCCVPPKQRHASPIRARRLPKPQAGRRKRGRRRKAEGGDKMKRFGLALVALAAGIVCAQAQDTLKIAIGQINNWENQAPTLGEEAGIFQRHNLKIESFGTQGAGQTKRAVI